MSKTIKKRISIVVTILFSMSLTPIYGYAGDATHYGTENYIVVQQPVVGAIFRSLGDNQFCIESTIGNLDLVPFIFTEADQKEITDIVNTFFSMGEPLCTTEQKEIMPEGVQHVNTTFVDSEMYSNQKRITFVDRIRGMNNNIKIKTGELFHFQVLSFTSTTDEEMVTFMEIAIEKVQEVYTRVFSSNNNDEKSTKKKSSSLMLRSLPDYFVAGTVAGIVVGTLAGVTVYVVVELVQNQR